MKHFWSLAQLCVGALIAYWLLPNSLSQNNIYPPLIFTFFVGYVVGNLVTANKAERVLNKYRWALLRHNEEIDENT